MVAPLKSVALFGQTPQMCLRLALTLLWQQIIPNNHNLVFRDSSPRGLPVYTLAFTGNLCNCLYMKEDRKLSWPRQMVYPSAKGYSK